MRVLLTGATGFVGPYLIDELKRNGHRCEIVRSTQLENYREARAAVQRTSFDAVVHLAGVAQTHKAGWDLYFNGNVLATLQLCRAIQEKGNKPVFLFSSSTFVYAGVKKKSRVFSETDPTAPINPYGSSKLAAENVVRAYASAFKRYVIVRSSNHTGPGQSKNFVCPGLASRIAAAKEGGPLNVGSLKSVRDFSDVRDITRAYRLMLEKKNAASLYVLGSGRRFSIQDVLNRLLSLAGKKVRIKQDPGLFRKVDPAEVIADARRARADLEWQPQYALARTLLDIYQHESKAGPFIPGTHHA